MCLRNPTGIPGAPTSIRLVGISEDSVTIEWTPVTSDGGRPVTRYVIEKREARSQFWTPVSSVGSRTTVYQIVNLLPNSLYYLRVAAENDEGVGFYREFIEPVRPMKPKSEYLDIGFMLNNNYCNCCDIWTTILYIKFYQSRP